MKKNFKVGDSVAWIDENLQGKVLKTVGHQLFVVTSEGFEMEVNASELVHLPSQSTLELDWNALQEVKKNELQPIKRKNSPKKSKKVEQPALEVDLHIDALTDHYRRLSNFEMLSLQLETAQRQINFAKQKRIKRVILIHGVGQGVLKAELETILRRDDAIDFYDADYKTYGLGATEVYIFEKP